jgi:hypothetical protein
MVTVREPCVVRTIAHFRALMARYGGVDRSQSGPTVAQTWHMANRRAPSDRSKRPLGAARLDELALAYVARFATSRAKLTRYLSRKIRESEWTDDA